MSSLRVFFSFYFLSDFLYYCFVIHKFFAKMPSYHQLLFIRMVIVFIGLCMELNCTVHVCKA